MSFDSQIVINLSSVQARFNCRVRRRFWLSFYVQLKSPCFSVAEVTIFSVISSRFSLTSYASVKSARLSLSIRRPSSVNDDCVTLAETDARSVVRSLLLLLSFPVVAVAVSSSQVDFCSRRTLQLLAVVRAAM